MLGIIAGFLGFQVLYHIFVVVGGYWFHFLSPEKIAILRDAIWILICSFFFLSNIKHRKWYFSHRWKLRIGLIILLLFSGSLSFFVFDKSLNELLIGIKYGLRYFIILFLAWGLGYFLKKNQKPDSKAENKWLWRLKYWLLTIIILGRIRQFLKILFPDRFQSIGYGQLDDYHFGVNPPIYYLTGFEWTLRRQGLFSGPNNYAYFLVVFLPVVWCFRPIKSLWSFKKRKKTDWISLFVVFLRLITLWATLSRAGIIWGVVVLLLLNISRLRSHKKTLWWGLLALVIGVLGLSILKRESTLTHIEKKFWWITEVINQPLGHWLWSSGPAIHHTGKFLPENFYLQLTLDMGSVGFLLWVGIMWLLFQEQKKVHHSLTANKQKIITRDLLLALEKWFLALLVMGLFLHVFEDSMVNYLFFSIYGILLWYLQSWIKKDENIA